MCEYVKWCNVANAGLCNADEWPFSTGTEVHDMFYTNGCTRDMYKDYVAYFLNRTNTITGIKYKDDPTILAWELANEPRARWDKTGTTLNNWIGEMSAYVKSIDHYHLVTPGGDGGYIDKPSNPEWSWWYHGNEGQDFFANHQWGTVDFATFRYYPEPGKFNDVDPTLWIQEHIEDAHNTIGKPVIMEEFGSIADRAARFSGYYSQMEGLGVNGDTFWMLSDDFFAGNNDGHFVLCPGNAELCGIISSHANFMNNHSAGQAANRPPVLSPMGDIKVNETGLVAVVASAYDPDNDTLSYSINGTKFSRSGNVFTWQTNYGDAGTYAFMVTVSDGEYADYAGFSVTVNAMGHGCAVPYNGMNISASTVLCNGSYFLPKGINIVNSHVSLDCNGSLIRGNYSGPYGIRINGLSGIAVKNCLVTGFGNGISVLSGEGITLTNNHAGGNINVNGNNITVHHNWMGAVIAGGANMTISENILGSSDHVIRLVRLYHSNIVNNNISWFAKWGRGISLDGVGNLLFENNTIQNGGSAFYCWYQCMDNIIRGNDIVNNALGIYEPNFYNTIIYHNNFINNQKSAQNGSTSTNQWDWNGDGNYWSSYDEPGEGCIDSDSDGICDSPYIMGPASQDHYPFVRENGWMQVHPAGDVNNDCIVNIFDLAAVGLAYGSHPGDFSWNPNADINDDGDINIFDLATVGLSYGKTC